MKKFMCFWEGTVWRAGALQLTQRLAIALLVVSLMACAVPYLERTGSQSITPPNASSDKSPDVRIVHETHEYGMRVVLAPHGAGTNRPSGSFHRYFLEKNGKRESLGFLDAASDAEQWENFLLIDGRWIALNATGRAKAIRLLQFQSSGASGPERDFAQTIDIPQKQLLRKLYVSNDRRYLVWTQFNARIYRQALGQAKSPELMARSEFDVSLPGLTLVPGFEFSSAKTREEFLLEIEKAVVGLKDGCCLAFGADADRATKTSAPQELEKFSRSPFDLVRWAVAENPATSREILERLSGDEHPDVAIAACRRIYP